MTTPDRAGPWAHRLIVVLALVVAVASGGSLAAAFPRAATPPTPVVVSAHVSDPGVDAVGPTSVRPVSLHLAAAGGRTFVLGQGATKRLIAFVNAGLTISAVLLCKAAVPVDFQPHCAEIVALAAALASLGSGGGKCLSITLSMSKPPVRVRLVPCQAKPEPEPEPNTAVPTPGGAGQPAPVPVPGGPVILVPGALTT